MISAFHGIFSFYSTPFHSLAVVPQRTSLLTTSTVIFYLYLSLSFVDKIVVNTAQSKHQREVGQLDQAMVNRAILDVKKCCQKYIAVNGGYFE